MGLKWNTGKYLGAVELGATEPREPLEGATGLRLGAWTWRGRASSLPGVGPKSKVPHPSAVMLPVLLFVMVGSVPLWFVGMAMVGARAGSQCPAGQEEVVWLCWSLISVVVLLSSGRCLGTVGLALEPASCFLCGFPCQQLPLL